MNRFQELLLEIKSNLELLAREQKQNNRLLTILLIVIMAGKGITLTDVVEHLVQEPRNNATITTP